MRTKVGFVLTLLCALAVGVHLGMYVADRHPVRADSQQEVAPYKFADMEGDVHVYKAVHEGCELFIVRGHALDASKADTVSITTGRGCK